MTTKPKTIDEYLAIVSDDQRAALERLRQVIQAAAAHNAGLIARKKLK